MESWESSVPVVTTPNNNNHPHSLSSSSLNTPMVATPEPRQIRIVKSNRAAFDSGSDCPKKAKISCGVSGMPNGLLPQKYEMLCVFFNAMISSIRLLRLKKLPSTLTRLSRSIESLTERRFTLHHLAQLKHIMPEVIVVKKIRVQDRETNCMKEDLLVSLEVDAVATDDNVKGGGGFSHLKGIFQSRLTHYFRTHDEDDNVPEGKLPHLFYQPKQEPEPSLCRTPAPPAVLHIAPSFKRRFSSRALGASVSESSPAKPSSCLLDTHIKEATVVDAKDESSISLVEFNAEPAKLVSTPAKLVSTPAKLALTPAKLASTPVKFASTPVKLASTPARLMAATPVLLPPKRPLMTPDHDCCSDVPNKSAKRRALNFEQSSNDIEDQPSQVGEEKICYPAQGSNASKDVLNVLPDDLLQSLIEKEQKILEDQGLAVSQEKRRQQLMAGVPKLFDMILLLFQSIRRPIVTKEELIYKLITGHLDIVDKYEVEAQFQLLREVAPEYVSEQQSLSGDTLLRLNKASCPESIRAKLLEAI
ncbi:CDT1-like protein a, chloroplastic [Chenopodium quinoa]|uniref:CDT1 Geminin-binding domain-containing protein n=1 Tax=Chenopodium quinoa TaxID=63459 RepID=A0A803KQJ1_CHEQI|nr:CDT1-like protein a, chloroplastic [Chenopodium quinoa]